jgi:hypothetical protein
MAIDELRHGLRGRIGPELYVEAVVGINNRASQRVAEQTVSPTPEAITDGVSGLPALRYLRLLDLNFST